MILEGVFCPVTTPFEREQIALDKLASNLEKFLMSGLDGYILFGSTGEAPYISRSERVELIKTARSLIPEDKRFIVGTGYETTNETISFTKHAADLGADCALVLTPNYYKQQMNVGNLVAHFSDVADQSPVPVILYNVPPFTGMDLSLAAIERLAKHPNIAGIKDSTANMTKLVDLVGFSSTDFSVLVGNAALYLSALILGAQGAVLALANVAPKECKQIHNYYREGSLEKARHLFLRLIPLVVNVTGPYGIPAIKAALDCLGYYGGPPRRPLRSLDDDVVEQIRGHLQKAEFLG